MSTDDDDSFATKAGSAGPMPINATIERTLRRIAHELRTPIGAIASSADIMRTEAFGPLGDTRYKEYAHSIRDSADHALNVVEQALENIDGLGDGASCQLALLDANAVIRRTVEQLQLQADDAQVVIETHLADGAACVASDAVKLQQIMVNAAGNAIKFSPIGSRVTITSRRSGSARTTIEIVDRGLGMGAAELSRIRQGTSDRGQGLRLMHELSRLAGAALTIDSTRGRGTTVRIDLSSAEDG